MHLKVGWPNMRKLAQERGIVSRAIIVDSNGAISFDMASTTDSYRRTKGTSFERIDLTGCIEWREIGGTIRIQFRPSLTTSSARDTIFRWLQCDHMRRIHLRYWRRGGWQDEIVGQAAIAVGRIEQIVYQEGGGGDAPLIRRLKTSSSETKTHREVVAFWSDRRDTFGFAADFPVLQDITGGRTIVLRLDSNYGYIASRAGLGMPPGLRRWMSNKPDQLLSDFPDSHYATQLRAAYDEAIQSSRPVADEVDGLIRFPSVPRQRYSYHRIIIPIAIGDAQYILSSTIKDDSIDLFS